METETKIKTEISIGTIEYHKVAVGLYNEILVTDEGPQKPIWINFPFKFKYNQGTYNLSREEILKLGEAIKKIADAKILTAEC